MRALLPHRRPVDVITPALSPRERLVDVIIRALSPANIMSMLNRHDSKHCVGMCVALCLFFLEQTNSRRYLRTTLVQGLIANNDRPPFKDDAAFAQRTSPTTCCVEHKHYRTRALSPRARTTCLLERKGPRVVMMSTTRESDSGAPDIYVMTLCVCEGPFCEQDLSFSARSRTQRSDRTL